MASNSVLVCTTRAGGYLNQISSERKQLLPLRMLFAPARPPRFFSLLFDPYVRSRFHCFRASQNVIAYKFKDDQVILELVALLRNSLIALHTLSFPCFSPKSTPNLFPGGPTAAVLHTF